MTLPGILGEFFTSEHLPTEDTSALLQNLPETMENIRPVPTTSCNKNKVFVHPELYSCSHVFLRDDTVRSPLKQPYTGPHKIIKRLSNKVYAVKIGSKICNVSVDRLKPAFMPQQDTQITHIAPTAPPTSTSAETQTLKSNPTRSGRSIKLPVRFTL